MWFWDFLGNVMGNAIIIVLVWTFFHSLWLAVKATAVKAWNEDRRFVTFMLWMMAGITVWAVIARHVRSWWLS